MSLLIYKFPDRNSRGSIEGNGLVVLSSLKIQTGKKNENLYFPGNLWALTIILNFNWLPAQLQWLGKFLYPQCRMSSSSSRVCICILDEGHFSFLGCRCSSRNDWSSKVITISHTTSKAPWIPAGCQWRMAGNAGILVLNNYPLKLGGL